MNILSRSITPLIGVVFCLMALPAVSTAQTGSAITGVVRDGTGGVLPGVTVEASSPALIEGTRTVVSDAQGVYRIVDLRPGTYKVTFTLAGFKSYVRDGFVLTSSFTATVNGVMEVGALEETITVTGEAPIVDTQATGAVEVFTRDAIEELPIARSTGVWAALVPAMRQQATETAVGGVDVGGTQSERSQAQVTVHGGPDDIRVVREGMEAMRGVYSMNRVDTQEVSIQMGGNNAEAETGGVRINIIPREGGNVFSGTFELDGSTNALQADNLDAALAARNLVGTPNVKQAYNVGGGLGGPIMQDKVWFFGSYRKWGSQLNLPGKYYNKVQGTGRYEPDATREADSNDYYQSGTARVTWAATDKQKFNFSLEWAENCNCLIRLIAQDRAPEAVADHFYSNRIPQGSWQYAASERFLIEGGVAWYRGYGDSLPTEGVGPNDIAVNDLGSGFRYNARADGLNGSGAYADRSMRNNITERVNVSYVTGSHNFKTGGWLQQWPNYNEYFVNGSARYDFRNGVPSRVTLFTSPLRIEMRALNLGLYAQDQWTVDRLTLNLGLRFDHYSGYAPETDLKGGTVLGISYPAQHFEKTDTLTSLKDLNPRMGAAYDLSGNGRTAVKGFIGRFIVGAAGEVPGIPAATTRNSATRAWTDNGDLIPQLNELGPLSDSRFGSAVSPSLTVDRDLAFGYGHRTYNWQGIASIDHEIVPGVGVQVAYYRTWFGNLTFTQNVALTGADFQEYSFVAPVSPLLPSDVSGSTITGLYDVVPSKRGLVDNFQTLAGDRMKQTFDGIDVNTTARFSGITISGGIAFGNTVVDNCGIVADSPEAIAPAVTRRFCREEFAWGDDVQFKLNGTIPLPYDFRTSFVFQSVPGFERLATYALPSASTTLGRPFTNGGTASVELIEPKTQFEDRTNNLDLRFSRRFQAERVTITGNLDVANILNSNTPQSVTTVFGPRYLEVANALSARLFRLGVQLGF